MENIETGLLLMVVGMATVFLILLIIIYIGKGLIVAVNKYAPEEAAASPKTRNTSPTPKQASSAAMPGQETAAIVAAISVLTHGQGKVTRIEKI